MQEPAIPVNESERLRALRRLDILDTLPEECFDRLTRIAVRLFDVPTALVSLVDSGRQWFKSRQGLEACQTERRVSFCGHAILSEDPLIVPDCLQDSRFSDNPLVVGAPHIRFYAGQPIHAPDGSRIGTLCLIHRQPREFSPLDRRSLADLAAVVDQELKLLSLTTIDELTQIANRRGFFQQSENILALCHRHAEVASLICIRLDGFGATNAIPERMAGDNLLRQFSKALTAHFRTSDVVARVSSDQFCILGSGATEAQMTSSLQRFVRSEAYAALRTACPSLSWSAGVIDFDPAYELDIDGLIRAANEKMCASGHLPMAARTSA